MNISKFLPSVTFREVSGVTSLVAATVGAVIVSDKIAEWTFHKVFPRSTLNPDKFTIDYSKLNQKGPRTEKLYETLVAISGIVSAALIGMITSLCISKLSHLNVKVCVVSTTLTCAVLGYIIGINTVPERPTTP